MKYTSLLALAVTIVSGCRKEIPAPEFQLPTATQTGANTLGFIVNDRVWQNYGRRCTMYSCHDNKLKGYLQHQNGSWEFSLDAGLNASGIDERFGLIIDSLRGPGTYTAVTIPNRMAGHRLANPLFFDDTKQRIYYQSKDQAPSRITITYLDTAAHIISGTFAGQLFDSANPTTPVTIRDGRFDITYEQ